MTLKIFQNSKRKKQIKIKLRFDYVSSEENTLVYEWWWGNRHGVVIVEKSWGGVENRVEKHSP